MGQLPLTRETVACPFLNAGTDYVGPFEIKGGNTRNKTTTKCYIALSICTATKAIGHLELVPNRTSEAFTAALKRFIARRGLTDHRYIDNGSNFVGANKELKVFFKYEEFFFKVACIAMQQRHNFSGIHFGGLF